MQMTTRVRAHLGRARRWSGRHMALAALPLLMAQCVPDQCAPAPPPAPPAPAPGTYFGWVGLGGALPSDAACAAAVRWSPEIRPGNAGYNATTWGAWSATYPRSTGSFTGTTDQIIQWAACKWGFDEDTLRAQVAKESWWTQTNLGDWTTNPASCAPYHPIGADGRPGECPESVGMMQVRTPYFPDSVEGSLLSSSYNLDVSLAVWRNCFEGGETWLNDVERGRQYAAGDAWGCIGRWFSGRWYTAPAVNYINEVQDYLNRRIWTTPEFVNFRG